MRSEILAGLEVQTVDALDAPGAPVVVLMHGFSMSADDLSPFGASMGLPAVFLFPDAPIDLAGTADARGVAGRRARAWWSIDTAARDAAIAAGIDRDLSDEVPPGLPDARARLMALLDEVARRWPGRPTFVGGFSQGAILTLDLVLRTGRRPTGLVLLSGARVDATAVRPLMPPGSTVLAGLPVFQSHGRADTELSFRAADTLSAELSAAGAHVTWRPFDGGHEIPLPVLRELKKFIRVNTVPGADHHSR